MSDDDDWETDPDFENDVTEEEQVRASSILLRLAYPCSGSEPLLLTRRSAAPAQRYGSAATGMAHSKIDMKALADSTKSDYTAKSDAGPKYDAGYGGERGDTAEQTTDAAGGTRVVTGKERVQATTGGCANVLCSPLRSRTGVRG